MERVVLGSLILAVFVVFGLHYLYRRGRYIETFVVGEAGAVGGISIADLTTRALDAAPTTSEVKEQYKKLLIFAHDDIRKEGVKGLRILADLRDRLFGSRDFRPTLTVDDFITPWPTWLPPLEKTMKEPVPEVSEAATAETRILAYLQKYFPQENQSDEQTGSTVHNMIDDFGYRFVFEKGKEVLRLRDDFLTVPLLRGWVNPAA